MTCAKGPQRNEPIVHVDAQTGAPASPPAPAVPPAPLTPPVPEAPPPPAPAPPAFPPVPWPPASPGPPPLPAEPASALPSPPSCCPAAPPSFPESPRPASTGEPPSAGGSTTAPEPACPASLSVSFPLSHPQRTPTASTNHFAFKDTTTHDSRPDISDARGQVLLGTRCAVPHAPTDEILRRGEREEALLRPSVVYTWRMVTPEGHRIEGLAVADVAEILRRLR